MCRVMAFYRNPFTSTEVGEFYRVYGATNNDASGVALVGHKKMWVLKKPLIGGEFWDQYGDRIGRRLSYSRTGLFHVRNATHGTPRDPLNNHPIVGAKGLLIHNGVVEPPTWIPNSSSDSRQLLLYWERYGFESWGWFKGWATVILYSKGRMYCYRSGETSPLYWKFVGEGVQLNQVGGHGWSSVPTGTVFEVTSTGLKEVVDVSFTTTTLTPDEPIYKPLCESPHTLAASQHSYSGLP